MANVSIAVNVTATSRKSIADSLPSIKNGTLVKLLAAVIKELVPLNRPLS